MNCSLERTYKVSDGGNGLYVVVSPSGKFIYVGATRAAQYLGMTCAGSLPVPLEPLRRHFGTSWAAPAATEQA